MQVCHSGGFVYPLLNDSSNPLCKNRLVITATDKLTDAWPEYWITNSATGEFTYYFTAAIRGHYPGTYPWMWGCKLGSFPFNSVWTNPSDWNRKGHPQDYNPDSGNPGAYSGPPWGGNNDRFTQFTEAFHYADCMDSYSQYGYHNNYPHCPLDETPQMGTDNGFSVDTLFCLNGIAGNTTANLQQAQTVASRSYLLGGNLNVLSAMTINSYAMLTMGVDSSIIDVHQNAPLIVDNGVKFFGASPTSINNKLLIESTSNSLDLEGDIFSHVSLQSSASYLTIGGYSVFDTCHNVLSNHGAASITYSYFYNSPLTLANQDNSSAIQKVTYCNFNENSADSITSIMLEDYYNYSITNNVIMGGADGISLFYCGWGTQSHLVKKNQISNCIYNGILSYSSKDSVTMNHVFQSQFGIKMMDFYSRTSLTGDQNANDTSDTQEINDCSGIEVYATDFCFPYMRFNAIINNNASVPYNPLVYYDDTHKKDTVLDVRYNCWGKDFNPSNDFYTYLGSFNWDPTWCPSGGGVVIVNSPDYVMFNNGMNYINAGDYTDAKSQFQLLVETYPQSSYAQEAMKELFAIEPYAGNDFNGLKVYYLTDDSIMADSVLTQLGDFLANGCNEKMEDWSDAISWYEDQIENPVNETDSLFAVIDLGHLYLIMDTCSQKSCYIGSLTQYKPKSKPQYVKYRDSLIALLPFPKDPLTKSIKKLQNGQLLQNVPNPATSSTDIYFKLFSATNAEIKIYNSWGQLQQVLPITDLKDGLQKITFNTSTLTAGVYEYSLSINERTTDTKKMVVIR